MNAESAYQWRKQLLWGLILIVVGAVIMLDRYDMIDLDNYRHYWPLLLVVLGVNKMISPASSNHVRSGLWLVFLGLWLFANVEHLFGMTYHNSWPFLLIAWGLAMVIAPLLYPTLPSSKEQHHEA